MLLAISVDLDEIPHYQAIHGLKVARSTFDVYQRAIPRLADWARQRRIPLTWFAVGQDLQEPTNAEVLARMCSGGDEIGCHSFSHPYDLTRKPITEMKREVEQGLAAIAKGTGQKATGFRAPGYVVHDTLLSVLQEFGLAYDSSVFPCPVYYAMKAAASARLAAKGRPTSAILDVPEVLRAPTVPYRVGRPYWFRGTGIWEIPIQVTRRARLPFIGTSLTMAGTTGARLLARGVLGEPFVNLELHGIDALDERDGLADLGQHQRDLRIPWAQKLDAIDAAVATLTQRGYRCVRMDELAAEAAAQ